ncbi:MAG: helix-turn-helix domain-containing protein [bacterium]|nr:helix-turn-helix domain-containing protein [bacterium]
METLAEILKFAGLNEKEAALYMAALNLGTSPMSALAKAAKLKRSTAYQIFDALEKRGIVGSFKTRSSLLFGAMSPDILYAMREKELAELASALPQLRALEEKKGSKPKLTYLEGPEGYRMALEDSLKKPNNLMRHIGSLTESHKTLNEKYDLDHYLPNRIKQRIRINCLYFTDIKKHLREREHGKELREIRYLPEKYWYEGSSLIYDNKVVIVSGVKEMMTVIIESETIAEAERQKFDLLWDLIGSRGQ